MGIKSGCGSNDVQKNPLESAQLLSGVGINDLLPALVPHPGAGIGSEEIHIVKEEFFIRASGNLHLPVLELAGVGEHLRGMGIMNGIAFLLLIPVPSF